MPKNDEKTDQQSQEEGHTLANKHSSTQLESDSHCDFILPPQHQKCGYIQKSPPAFDYVSIETENDRILSGNINATHQADFLRNMYGQTVGSQRGLVRQNRLTEIFLR